MKLETRILPRAKVLKVLALWHREHENLIRLAAIRGNGPRTSDWDEGLRRYKDAEEQLEKLGKCARLVQRVKP